MLSVRTSMLKRTMRSMMVYAIIKRTDSQGVANSSRTSSSKKLCMVGSIIVWISATKETLKHLGKEHMSTMQCILKQLCKARHTSSVSGQVQYCSMCYQKS
eukprot:1151365-Pelagomonas_calceolata.AAC.1